MGLFEVLEDYVCPAAQGFIPFSSHLCFYQSFDLSSDSTVLIIFVRGSLVNFVVLSFGQSFLKVT